MLSWLALLIYFGSKILLFLFINILLLSSGVFVGIALNKFIPFISKDIGSLIGVLSLVVSFHYCKEINKFFRALIDGEEEEDENERVIIYPEKYFRPKKNRGKRKK